MPIDVATASYLLSSLASTGKLLEFALGLNDRRLSQIEAQAEVKSADQYAAQRFNPTSPAVVTIAGSLTGPIMKALVESAESIRDFIVNLISDRTMPAPERDQRFIDLKRKLCSELNKIKHITGGTLPPELQREWDNLMCSNYTYGV